jgi:hypothetical protein
MPEIADDYAKSKSLERDQLYFLKIMPNVDINTLSYYRNLHFLNNGTIIKAKILLPQTKSDHSMFLISCLGPFVF